MTSTALQAPNAANERSQNTEEDPSCSTLEPLEALGRSGAPVHTNGVKHVFTPLSRSASSSPSPRERAPTRATHLSWPCWCRATGHHHARNCFCAGPWQSAHAGERDLFKPLLPVREHHALAVCPFARSQLANGCPIQSPAMERQREARRAVRAPADAHVHPSSTRTGPLGT